MTKVLKRMTVMTRLISRGHYPFSQCSAASVNDYTLLLPSSSSIPTPHPKAHIGIRSCVMCAGECQVGAWRLTTFLRYVMPRWTNWVGSPQIWACCELCHCDVVRCWASDLWGFELWDAFQCQERRSLQSQGQAMLDAWAYCIIA